MLVIVRTCLNAVLDIQRKPREHLEEEKLKGGINSKLLIQDQQKA